MTAADYRQVPRSAWEGVETVYFPYSDLSPEIIAAIHQAVPDGATYGFNHDHRRAWVTVTKPGDTRSVLLLPPSLFEHPAAELSVDDSAQLSEDRRQLIT
jgi:hypothetical protein